MKNILVTGGAGYIGSHAVKILAERGYNPVVVDNLCQGHKKLVQDKELHIGNVGDESFMRTVFKKRKFDAVMHFAAHALVGESVKTPLKYYLNNTCNSMNLLKIMLENGVNKIIYSSTAATYGEPTQKFITEDHPKNPINPYGGSKLAFEKILKDTSIATDLKYVVVKYFNVAGAHESAEIGEIHDPETHIVPIALEAIIKGTEFTVFGDDYDTPDGTCVRDYIHPNDLIKAHILAMEYLDKNKEPKTYNLGNGKGFSVKQIIDAVNEVTGKKLKIKIGRRREGDPAVLIASSEKISKELGWKADFTDIKRIIKSAYRWHSKQLSNKL